MRNRLNIHSSALSLFLQKPKTVRLFVEEKKIFFFFFWPNVCGKFPKSVEVIWAQCQLDIKNISLIKSFLIKYPLPVILEIQKNIKKVELMAACWLINRIYVTRKGGIECSGSDGKESACNAGDTGSILRSGRSPGEGNGNPLQYSCPENYMGKEAWWATVHEVTKSQTWLSTFHFFRFLTRTTEVERNISSKSYMLGKR